MTLQLKSVILKILSVFFETLYYNTSAGIIPEYMLSAVRKLEQNAFTDNIKISELANEANLSVDYFSKLFYKYYGMTPKKYINKLKLERAAVLLAVTDKTIYEICEICCFYDASHLNRLFREKYNMTPTRYRKENHLRL